MQDDLICPIWKTPARAISGYEGRDGIAVFSPRAGGAYFMTGTARAVIESATDTERVKLTNEIIAYQLAGATMEVTSHTVAALASTRPISVVERSQNLLQYLIRESKHIGQLLEFPPEWAKADASEFFMMPWPEVSFASAQLFAWSGSLEWSEVSFLLKMLRDDGLVELSDREVQPDIMVTPRGFSRADAVSERTQSDQAFVAMWFDRSMDDAFANGFEPGIRMSGFRPLRIDGKEHVNKIDDEIIAEIRKSKFVVADFTSAVAQPRGGVYFEAGFAMGLGIPVIWTCREDVIADVHFDTRQFNHIVWRDADELRTRLNKRILAVIGQGPAKGG